MFRLSCVLAELKRFNGWSTKSSRFTPEKKAQLKATFRANEARYIARGEERAQGREHNISHRAYGSQLHAAAMAIGDGPGGRTPEKLSAMRHMLELSQAAKAEGRRTRGHMNSMPKRRR